MSEAALYDYWRSSASYRLRIALNLAKIPYRSEVVDLLARAHKSPEHLARNPQGLVPVLEIDGHRFTQSLAILDYLNETRDLGLLPDDPAERARVRALAQSIAVDLHPICNLSVASHAARLAGSEDAKPAWMQHFIAPGLEAFEALLAGFKQAPYCCGDQVSLADICLIPQLYNATRWGVDYSVFPRIRAVAVACAAVPAFADAHPDAVNPG